MYTLTNRRKERCLKKKEIQKAEPTLLIAKKSPPFSLFAKLHQTTPQKGEGHPEKGVTQNRDEP